MKQVGLQLHIEDAARLKIHCAKTGKSQTGFMRDAITRELEAVVSDETRREALEAIGRKVSTRP